MLDTPLTGPFNCAQKFKALTDPTPLKKHSYTPDFSDIFIRTVTDSVVPWDVEAARAEEGVVVEGEKRVVRRLDHISFFRCITLRT